MQLDVGPISGFARILRYNYVHRTCYDAQLSECRKSLFINTYGSNIKKIKPDNARHFITAIFVAFSGALTEESMFMCRHAHTKLQCVHTCACIHMYICVDRMTVRVVLMRCVLLNSC